jgi:hypothetical protein
LLALSCAGAVAALGGVADLGPFLGDSDMVFTEYVPYYRDVSAVVNGRTIGVPLDGDTLLLYYRKDLFQKHKLRVPQTWDDMLAISRQMNSTDTNGDGQPDLFGACFDVIPGKQLLVPGVSLNSAHVCRSRHSGLLLWLNEPAYPPPRMQSGHSQLFPSYHDANPIEAGCKGISLTLSVAASILQHLGSQQGYLFDPDDVNTLKPLVDNPGKWMNAQLGGKGTE